MTNDQNLPIAPDDDPNDEPEMPGSPGPTVPDPYPVSDPLPGEPAPHPMGDPQPVEPPKIY